MSRAVCGDRLQSRLNLAKEALRALITRLRADDRFGLATFTREGHVLQPLTQAMDLSEDLQEKIENLSPGGGTTLAAGMEAAIQISGEAPCQNRHRRLLFLTDMEDLNPGQLDHLVASQAQRGLYVSFVGIGMDFNTALAEVVTRHRGANYFCITRQEELHKTMVTNFDWNFFPAAFNVEVTHQSSAFELAAVYGTAFDTCEELLESEWMPDVHKFYPQSFKAAAKTLLLCVQRVSANGLPMPAWQKIFGFLAAGVRTVIRADTAFPTAVAQDGSVDGGLVLLRMKSQAAHGPAEGKVQLTLRYEAAGKFRACSYDVVVPAVDAAREETCLDKAMRKGKLLQQYVETCKQYLELREPLLQHEGHGEYAAKVSSALDGVRALRSSMEAQPEDVDDLCPGVRQQQQVFAAMAEDHAKRILNREATSKA